MLVETQHKVENIQRLLANLSSCVLSARKERTIGSTASQKIRTNMMMVLTNTQLVAYLQTKYKNESKCHF